MWCRYTALESIVHQGILGADPWGRSLGPILGASGPLHQKTKLHHANTEYVDGYVVYKKLESLLYRSCIEPAVTTTCFS